MRKQYVSINDMGTSRQNPQREPYYEPELQPPFQPGVVDPRKGRTLITDIEESAKFTPSHVVEEIKRPVPHVAQYRNDDVGCQDVMRHVMSCPLCSKIYTPDPMLYYMIIAILAAVVVVLLVRKNTI